MGLVWGGDFRAGVFYLEVPQRLKVINGRVDVLQDMLRLLKVCFFVFLSS